MPAETHNPNVEERIIVVAKNVFMEKGYTDASMSEIAERVGINRPGLHYYFRTKDKLFNAVFSMIIDSIIPRFLNIMQMSEQTIAQRVEQIIDMYYQILQENPYLPLFLAREINRDTDFLIKTFTNLNVEHFFEELKQCLQEEMANGNIRKVPLRIVFFTFYSALTFPFISRGLVVKTMMEEEETFQTVLQQWKPYIISQMVNLLSVDKQ